MENWNNKLIGEYRDKDFGVRFQIFLHPDSTYEDYLKAAEILNEKYNKPK